MKIALFFIIVIIAVSVSGIFGYLRFGLPPAHFAGQCETLNLNESAEDMQIDRERGIAYLSLIDRMALAKKEPAQGWIGRLDLNSGSRTIEPALIDPPGHFRPHGLSLFIDANGQRTMAVINHPVNRGEEAEHVVLFREEQPGRFRYLRTFTDDLIARPNDLVAVGPEQYYIANDSPPNSGETTRLVYVDADNARVVMDGIRSGGGINMSLDGNFIYVAETQGETIHVLKRDPTDGTVESVKEIAIGTAPDNIDVAEDGSLWIGAHSSLFGLIMHFIAGTDAPSQVLRVDLDSKTGTNIKEIYYNRGDEISASSVGLTYGNKLLIGSITAHKILICEMDDAWRP
ncbi:MAG: SMP-30/gluconolactonase/LRE family protein [Gammaproteobacteria bacterium]|nr:SMP-30/gluconolactonase/LRE family protein [Gammaproteobacteria bacterium]